MEKLIDNILELNFDELLDYSFPLDEPFGLRVNFNGMVYEFIIKFSSNNKNLICAAPSAHARDERTSKGILKTPPFIDRFSWNEKFDESFIGFADPTLYYDDEIRMGWFVGDKNHWYLEDISKILLELITNQKIRQDNILFYGSSSGGFASIGLGTFIKGSKVLVNNSQFNINHYYLDSLGFLFKLLKDSYPELSIFEIKEEIKERLNLVELFKKEKYVPPITYYINIASESDVGNHAIPFIKDLQYLEFFENNFNIVMYNEIKNTPHSPLSGSDTLKLVKMFSKINLYNQDNTEQDDRVIDLKAKYCVDSLENKIESQSKKLIEVNELNESLLNSISWKVTKPLRLIKSIFKY